MRSLIFLCTLAVCGAVQGAAPAIEVSAEPVKLERGLDGIRFTLTNKGKTAHTMPLFAVPAENVFTTRMACLVYRAEAYTLEGSAPIREPSGERVTIKPGGSIVREVVLDERFKGFHKLREKPGVVLAVSWLWCSDELRDVGVGPKAGTVIFQDKNFKSK
jgi:hypothetical protein